MSKADPKQPFCHLHMHTGYSLLDSTLSVKKVVKAAADLGMSALAITDHGVMNGAITFYNACRSAGIKPIVGCELYVADDMHKRERMPDGSVADHLLLLAKNDLGYENLMRIVTQGHLKGFYYKPRVDLDLIAKNSKHLIATSCCPRGSIPKQILADTPEIARQTAGQFREIFGKENFYLELNDHGLESEQRINRALVELARQDGYPLVATNDVHYLKRQHHEAHEVMLCLQTQTTMQDERRLRFQSDQYYLKSQAEMWSLFGEQPEALTHTMEIASRCNLELQLNRDAPPHFPSYKVPEGHDYDSYLLQLAREGVAQRYDGADINNASSEQELTLKARIDMEFKVIKSTGFVNYFLVVWDFINYARSQKIPVGPGRGSGAGSLIAYALGITAIDPLRYGLIFERFLNPDRVSPPDFDIDFCQSRRGEVIEYVKQKYGAENCAQIITFGSLGAKTIIRDLGRVLGVELSYCDRLAKMVPDDPGMTLEKAEMANPEFKQAIKSEELARQIMKYAPILEGQQRNQGTHAAGVVIGEKPLIEIIPLCRDKDHQPVAQYEMKPLEMTGLLKMDFLGLKTLTVIQEAVDNVRETRGTELDLDSMEMDDKETFELLNRGDTIGVFQVESKGMRDLLRQFQLRRFEDLIAMIALYRPGPMDMIPDFVKRRHGIIDIAYPHPLLEPVLEETYGVFVYQEQVQQAANVLAGFTLAQGDLLRRAMGKKDAVIMREQRQKFIDGCVEKDTMPAQQAGEIFDLIQQFASYGFNKSHSAAYAVISYQTAYLKAHYPSEFMAALLSSEMNKPDKLPGIIAEVQEMGTEVLPPNIQQSVARFRPEGEAVRFGLVGIKNVGAGAVEALVANRKSEGPFKSFMDFMLRVDSHEVNKKTVESLIKCGTFDWTGLSRSRLYYAVDWACTRAQATLKDRASGQISLFGALEGEAGEDEISDEQLPAHDPWPESEMLAYEKELIGFYISGHPLQQYEWEIKTYGQHDIKELADLPKGHLVRVGGLATAYIKRFTKKTQEVMCTFRLEGLDAGVETVMFPAAFQLHGSSIANDLPVMVGAELDHNEGAPKLMVQEVYPLEDAARLYARTFKIHLPASAADQERLNQIRACLEKNPGSTPVSIVIEYPEGQKVSVATEARFNVTADHRLLKELHALLGEEAIYVESLPNPLRAPPPRRSFGKGRN